MRLTCAILLILTAAAMLFAGCGEAPDNSAPLRIAFISTFKKSTYWLRALERAEERAAKLGNIEVVYMAPESSPAVDEQIAMLENCVYEGYNGIILAATDKDRLIEPIKNAKGAGIPVVMIDTGVSEPVYDALLATNNEDAGAICAVLMAKLIGGEGEIAIINFSATAQAAMSREYGFVNEIAKNWPLISIVGVEYCNSNEEEAARQAEEFVNTYPGLKGMWGANGPAMSGVVAGIAAQGKEGGIAVVGFDNYPGLKPGLESGAIKASVVQRPGVMGAEGVQIIYDILHGNPPQSNYIDTGVTVLTKDSLKDDGIVAAMGW
jgi:ribose transport system substrate-binding protein